MDEFQILVLSSLTLLTVLMFIFFYLIVIKSKHEQNQIKRELQAMQISMKENSPTNCLHYFGYLSTYPRDKPIPDECLGCSKVILCYEKRLL